MNKDVVYIEPEDDITDVINHIKAATQKVVALVPPQKPGILRSAINIKLIAKTAKECEKAVVLVTTDPSIVKLAAVSGIPVAKTLQSRPVIPSIEQKEEKAEKTPAVETITDDSEDETPAEDEEKPAKSAKKPAEDMHLNSAELEDDDKKSSKKSKKPSKIPNFDKYRKFIIAGGVALVALVAFLIWAIGFSGAAEILVKIRTSSSNFSENVSFVTTDAEVDAKAGKIRLEKVEYSKDAKVEFTPTGEKDFGNKASGKLLVSMSYADAATLEVAKGTTFTTGGLTFVATEGASVSWDGKVSTCADLRDRSCMLSASVDVIASEGGTNYNISAGQAWTSSVAGLSVSNSAAFAGGTSDIAKVVTEEDVKKAKEQFNTSESGKEELLGRIAEDTIAIDASYTATPADPVASPAVGEKASGKATLTAKTTYSIYAVSREAISDFVKASVINNLGVDQIVYDIGTPFFERFVDNNGAFSARLKTTIKSGPKVTEQDILEKSRGKKIGEVQTLIQSINGVSSVKVNTSYPWVRSVPNNDEKITITIEVEE